MIHGMKFSHTTMRNWTTKYVELMVSLLQIITPQVEEQCHADKVWVKICGNMKYLFAMMGGEMRFVLAQEVDSEKSKEFVTNGLDTY